MGHGQKNKARRILHREYGVQRGTQAALRWAVPLIVASLSSVLVLPELFRTPGSSSGLVVVVTAGTIRVNQTGSTGISLLNLATLTIALGALVIGVVEWTFARKELSIDHYYDRLKIANDYRQALDDKDDRRMPPFTMYALAEIDNLEYVIERYHSGFMTPEQALRGVRTFYDRLREVRDFEGEVKEITHNKRDASGYNQRTIDVLRCMLNKLQADSARSAVA